MSGPDRGDSFQPTDENDTATLPDEKPDEKPEEKAEDKPEEKLEAKSEDKGKEEEKAPEPRIPLSRHKTLLETERGRTAALETKLAEALAAGNKGQSSADNDADEKSIAALEEKYNKLMLEGDVADATKAMGEIRKLERMVNDRTRASEIAHAEARAVETVRYATVVERLEEAYPQINPDHEDYDKEAVAEVLELKAAFEGQRHTPSAALQRAMKYVFAPKTGAQDTATSVTPRVTEADLKNMTAAERKAAAITKAVDAAARTPGSTNKLGIDSDKAGGGIVDAKAVLKMSPKDFAALGEDQLSKLRGDTL